MQGPSESNRYPGPPGWHRRVPREAPRLTAWARKRYATRAKVQTAPLQRTESELRARSSLHLNWAQTVGNERLYCAKPPRAETGDSRHGRGPHPSRPSPPVLQEELSRPATLRVGLWVLVAPCPDTGPRCEVGVPDPGPGSWARVPRVHRDEYRRTQSNSVPSAGPSYPV